MRGVKENGINRDVPRGLIIVQHVIPIPHKKHVPKDKLEVKIGKQEIFKSLILKHPMSTLKKHVLVLEFLLPFPIER
jgi:hypothetical protein